MVYYERFGFSAFVALNERSEYIGSVPNSTVGGYPSFAYILPHGLLELTSVFVAVIIVLGGPQLLAAVRRRAIRDAGQ